MEKRKRASRIVTTHHLPKPQGLAGLDEAPAGKHNVSFLLQTTSKTRTRKQKVSLQCWWSASVVRKGVKSNSS